MKDREVFIINVEAIEGLEEYVVALSKPDRLYDGKYWVKDGSVVFINDLKNFPVYLQLVSNVEIWAVGFSEKPPPMCLYTEKGPCGGCFSLESSFSERSDLRRTPVIKDDPRDIQVSYYFDFRLGTKKHGPIDPQIYNHGDTLPPDEKRRRGGCLGVAGRLVFGR